MRLKFEIMSRFIAGTLLLLSAASVVAQDVSYDRYLLPVYQPYPVDGAFGSRWLTEVIISNAGHKPVLVRNLSWACNLVCFDVPLPAGVSIPLVFRSLQGTNIPARFVEIERGASNLAIQLRVRDVSHQDRNWGADVPVIAEEIGRPRVHITGIPLRAGYRQILRIYDLARTGMGARVRLFDVNPIFREGWPTEGEDAPLAVMDLPFARGAFDQPGYAEISDLSGVAASRHGVIRVDVESLDGESGRLWALATVTNNATSEITNITPGGPQ